MEDKNESLLFKKLCLTLEKISQTKKRLEIQQILSDYFKILIKEGPEGLTAACYLCLGSIFPDCHNKELGIGESMLLKIISEFTNKSIKSLKEEHRITGDYGIIASKYKAKQLSFFRKKDLTVIKIHEELKIIANETGSKSQASKQRMILSLICNTEKEETKYLVRILEGKLKIGLALKTVLMSLGIAFSKRETNEEAISKVKEAFNCKPIFESLIDKLLEKGIKGLNEIKIEPGVPVKPMLAQPTKNITSAIKRVSDKFTCEYKYDGERAQIHKINEEYKIYSRNSEDLTEKYPELSFLEEISIKKANFILDSEIVAFDFENKKILPFQILTTRKRKNVSLKEIKISVCIFVFDVLFFDEPLIEASFLERRTLLHNNFNEIEGKFHFVRREDCKTVDEIDSFFMKSISDNCEGIMIKNLESNSEYTPSRRCYNWIKLKKDYLVGMADSLDLVVIGCYYGKGKRTGSFGGFLMGCYNDEKDAFETVCKLGTGFDDESLINFYKKFVSLGINKPSNVIYKEGTEPDLWVEPKEVWEVQAAGLSLSPVYTAGNSSMQNGVSLRFPRFIRERSDKGVYDCTNSSQVVEMYYNFEENEEESSSGEY